MWQSKADMLNDLAEYSTFGTDFDDSHIVRGMGPPRPRVYEDVDDELRIRFGDEGSRPPLSGSCQSNIPGPDLRGITEMLRMVDTFDKPEEKQPAQSEVCEDTVVTISKINPNSVEIRHSQTLVNNNKTKAISPASSNKKIREKQENVHEELVRNNKDGLDLKLREHELKNKITSMSKPKTFKQKSERNVAIANLMRLMTRDSTPKSSTSTLLSKSPQPKLESPLPLTTDCHADLTPSNRIELLTPEYLAGPSCSPKVLDIDENELMIPETKTLHARLKTNSSPKEMLDSHIKESIEKVTKWLSPKDKTKSSPAAPHSGTVLFRKKESKSSCNVPSEKSEQEPVPSPLEEYVPSSDVQKLKEQYAERIKAKEELVRKNQPPPDKLKPLQELGISFTFSGRDYDNIHEL